MKEITRRFSVVISEKNYEKLRVWAFRHKLKIAEAVRELVNKGVTKE